MVKVFPIIFTSLIAHFISANLKRIPNWGDVTIYDNEKEEFLIKKLNFDLEVIGNSTYKEKEEFYIKAKFDIKLKMSKVTFCKTDEKKNCTNETDFKEPELHAKTEESHKTLQELTYKTGGQKGRYYFHFTFSEDPGYVTFTPLVGDYSYTGLSAFMIIFIVIICLFVVALLGYLGYRCYKGKGDEE